VANDVERSTVEVLIEGGRLQGVLTTPPTLCAGALLLHPHPLYGGCKEDRVITAVEAIMNELGIATLRFDFRGVHSNAAYAGVHGAVEDALAAMHTLQNRLGATEDLPLGVAGYSFGASVGLHAAALRDVAFVISISASHSIAAEISGLEDRLSAISCPVLLVHGDRDMVVPVSDARTLAEMLDNTHPAVRIIFGEGHFFHRALSEVTAVVRRFLEEVRFSATSSEQ